jgi:hypothetical protein
MPNHHPTTEPARHYAPPTRRLQYTATAVAWLVLLVAAVASLLVIETAGRYYP